MLVEMAAAIAIGTVVLTVAALMLHALLRSDAELREESDRTAVISALAQQFRADAHEAMVEPRREGDSPIFRGDTPIPQAKFDVPRKIGTVPRAGRGIVLRLADQREVVYEPAETGLQRTERRGETVLARETYKLGEVEVGLRIDAASAPVAVCTIRPRASGSAAYQVQIEAVLGKDQQWTKHR